MNPPLSQAMAKPLSELASGLLPEGASHDETLAWLSAQAKEHQDALLRPDFRDEKASHESTWVRWRVHVDCLWAITSAPSPQFSGQPLPSAEAAIQLRRAWHELDRILRGPAWHLEALGGEKGQQWTEARRCAQEIELATDTWARKGAYASRHQYLRIRMKTALLRRGAAELSPESRAELSALGLQAPGILGAPYLHAALSRPASVAAWISSARENFFVALAKQSPGSVVHHGVQIMSSYERRSFSARQELLPGHQLWLNSSSQHEPLRQSEILLEWPHPLETNLWRTEWPGQWTGLAGAANPMTGLRAIRDTFAELPMRHELLSCDPTTLSQDWQALWEFLAERD